MKGFWTLFLVIFISNLIGMSVAEEGTEEVTEVSDDSYHTFECTEDNKNEHFDKMAHYMDHVIPILQMMSEQSESVGQEHDKHKQDIKAMVIHFQKYNQTKEELRIKCSDSNTPIEDCCQEIKALEKKFHDEMSINHEEHTTS